MCLSTSFRSLRLDDLPDRLRSDHVHSLVGDDDQDPDEVPSDDGERITAHSIGAGCALDLVEPFQLITHASVLVGVRLQRRHRVKDLLDQIVDCVGRGLLEHQFPSYWSLITSVVNMTT